MTLLDGVICFLLAMGAWRGYQVGFVKTVLLLIGWAVALVMAVVLSASLTDIFIEFTQHVILQRIFAFLLVVAVIVCLCHMIIFILQKVLKSLHLSFLDKLMGAMIGMVKSLVKILILIGVTAPLLVKLPSWQQSIIAQQLLPFAPLAKELLSETLDKTWQQFEVF